MLRGHEEWRDLSRTALEVAAVAVFDAREPPYPRANGDADAMRIRFADLEPAVANRLNGSRYSVVDERVHLAGFLARDVLADVEILDGTNDAHRHVCRVEVRDRSNPAAPGDDVLPAFLHGVADWRQMAKARDYHATSGQMLVLTL